MPECTRWQNAFQSFGNMWDIQRVRKNVAPEPSERITGVIGRLGSCAPQSWVIGGASQFVICPVKILMVVWPDGRLVVIMRPVPGRGYLNARPPATSGT